MVSERSAHSFAKKAANAVGVQHATHIMLPKIHLSRDALCSDHWFFRGQILNTSATGKRSQAVPFVPRYQDGHEDLSFLLLSSSGRRMSYVIGASGI